MDVTREEGGSKAPGMKQLRKDLKAPECENNLNVHHQELPDGKTVAEMVRRLGLWELGEWQGQISTSPLSFSDCSIPGLCKHRKDHTVYYTVYLPVLIHVCCFVLYMTSQA